MRSRLHGIHHAQSSERERDSYLSPSTTSFTAKIPAKVLFADAAFCIPKLGFTFTAPDGFTLENTAQRLSACAKAGPKPCASMWFASPAGTMLSDYLNSGWMENIDKSSTEELTVNGFPAATVLARGDHGNSVSMPCALA